MATKVQNNNNIGNPWHDDQGQFTTPGGGNASNNQDSNNGGIPSFLKKKGESKTGSDVPSFLKKKAGQGGSSESTSEKIKKIKKKLWWKNRDLYTPQQVADNITEFFDDDVLSFLDKYGLKTTNPLGAMNTSHSRINTVLANAIAKQMFNPLNVMNTQQFDAIVKNLKLTGNVFNRNTPFADFGFLQRGFNNKGIINQYLGEESSDCILPNGVHGSCIYTAYDGRTAYSYGGYVMSLAVDNKKAKTITSSDYMSKRRELIQKMPDMKNKIVADLKQRGKDDVYANRVAQIFENTVIKDNTLAAILMGYEIVYQDHMMYGLLLNFKNTYTKKDW